MTYSGQRGLMTVLVFFCLLSFSALNLHSYPDPNESAATGEEEGGNHEGGHSPVFRWINLAILVAGLGYVLRRPLAQFFSQRTESIQKSLEEGRKALATAEAQLEAVEQRLQHFEEAMAAFRTGALKEMEEEHDRLRQTTSHDVEKMMDSVRVQMDVASKQARLELRLHAAELSVQLAEQAIAQRMDGSHQSRLVSQFVERLATEAESG